MDFVSIFFFLGAFTLIQLCWQDWKYRLVKTDLSSYMMGVTGVIFLSMDLLLIWIGFMLLIAVGLSFLKQIKPLTAHIQTGDITILSWIAPSLIVLNQNYFLAFAFFYCLGNIIMFAVTKNKTMAGVTPMFFSFLITWALVVLTII